MAYRPQIKKLDYYESGSPGGTDTVYAYQNYEKTATYVYVGYKETGGAWYIYRRTVSSNVRQYASGASDYATNWTNRASLTYA